MDLKKRNRDEDMKLLDTILFLLRISAGFLGMGTGLMICFHVL